jgi:hypothetical protein
MKTLQHKFVEFIPVELEDKVLYISLDYCTAIHKCICGCGNKVVTPLSPAQWKLTFDGNSISLFPSIGNWSFECQSHYWIINNKIRLAKKWNKRKIDEGKKMDSYLIEALVSKRKKIP